MPGLWGGQSKGKPSLDLFPPVAFKLEVVIAHDHAAQVAEAQGDTLDPVLLQEQKRTSEASTARRGKHEAWRATFWLLNRMRQGRQKSSEGGRNVKGCLVWRKHQCSAVASWTFVPMPRRVGMPIHVILCAAQIEERVSPLKGDLSRREDKEQEEEEESKTPPEN